MILNRVMPVSKILLSHLWFGHLIFWIMTTSFLRKRRGAYWYLPINASPFKPHCHHLPFVYYKFSRFPNLPESLPCPPYGILPTHYSLNACQAPLCIHQMCIFYLLPQSGILPSSLLCRSPLSYQKRTFSCSGCSAPAYQPTA